MLGGTIACGLWFSAAFVMNRRKKLRFVYPMLGIVLLFFYVPIIFLELRFTMNVPGNTKWYYGSLLSSTPFIREIQAAVAVVWLAGAVFSLGRYFLEYRGFRRILNRSIAYRQPEKRMLEIQRELGIREKIEVQQNYAVTSPIVVGSFRKRIIFPVRNYEPRETDTILYHELVHVKQKILWIKRVGILTELIFWCNPMVKWVMGKIDEWGETACDVYVCHYTNYSFSQQKYYYTAVDTLAESGTPESRMVTGLVKQSNFKRRIMHMKGYDKKKDFKTIGGVILCFALCAATTTTALAAGVGIKAGYEKMYAETLPQDEEVTLSYVEGEEYTEIFDEENYKDYDSIDMEDLGISVAGTIDTLDTSFGKTKVTSASFYAKSGQSIVTAFTSTPTDVTIRVGIIDPSGVYRFVYGSGTIFHEFELTKTGYYQVAIINDSTTEIHIIGSYYVAD